MSSGPGTRPRMTVTEYGASSCHITSLGVLQAGQVAVTHVLGRQEIARRLEPVAMPCSEYIGCPVACEYLTLTPRERRCLGEEGWVSNQMCGGKWLCFRALWATVRLLCVP